MRYDELKTYTYNANGLLSSVTNKDGTTDLTWDILMGAGVVISANTNGVETNYTYGLERISAQTGKTRTEYIYDGRGSVAAEVSYNNAWYTFGGAFSKKDVTTKSYTPFGEQIGEAVSGFGYNGEYYNAATGMVYLRARFYEPAMNRFSQKDIVRGSITAPNSLNRYTYVQNDPINFIDPSGQSLKSAWNMVKSSVTNTVKNIVSNPVQAVKSAAKAVVNAVTHPIKTATNAAKSAGNAVRTIYNEVRTPDSQSKYASPATNRGTGSASSGGSYNGSSGGGAYTAPVYSPYDSNGNATSYNNSSYQSGKAPSPDAPRIEDVTADSVYYCSTNKPIVSEKTMLAVQAKNLPPEGEPGSDQTLKNPDGTPKQKRWYGEDGKPVRDRDYNHSGKGIPFPHDHEWKDGKRQKEHLPPSPEYQFSLEPAIGVGIIIVGGVAIGLVLADNITGIGVGDDFLLGPIAALISKGIVMVGV